MQSIVEVVCMGGGSNKTYNSVYTDPGYCKMVIVQDDDKFPSPRLCLLRRWPNFEGGFGFNLYEDLISSTGALKVEEVVRHSPAEAGGLRRNDVIIEINGDNIEFKSFFRLVEILKEACSQNEMELLVLAEHDADWYRVRNICVNSNFPNIEYCETPYYGHILKPLESLSQVNIGNNTTQNGTQPRMGTSQIEFHSSTGKLYRTTLVIDKEKDSVYRRIEELPSQNGAPTQSADQLAQTMAPLRPDGSYRHPSNDTSSVRVYYRRDREFLSNNAQIINSNIKTANAGQTGQSTDEYQTIVDSGHGSISNRRSTPLSTTTGVNMNTASMSPYSTLGKSYGEQAAVDLLHDKWADLMDKYLDNKFRSSSSASGHQGTNQDDSHPDRDASAGGTKRNYTIRLNDPNATVQSKRSRCQSPNADGSFSYLYSGRDDYQTASATSFRDLNRQTSPYQHLVQQYQRGTQQTQSNRYPSPLQSVQSPTRTKHQPNRHTSLNINHAGSNIAPSETTATSSSSSPLFQQYESSSFSTHSTSTSHHHKSHVDDSVHSNLSRAPHDIILRPKAISHSLGFQLDENEVIAKGYYFVKFVDPNSASAQAGLKEGDKITKINGKSTGGMGYDEFCNEIAIAQQQQLKNNMIHLMVMRRSAKTSTGSTSSVSANALSSVSGSGSGIGPTVLPIKNNMYLNDKNKKQSSSILSTSTSSNLVDEGYVPGSVASATSSSHTAALDSSTSNMPYNLVSVVRVTSPTKRSEIEQVSNKQQPTKPVHKITSESAGHVPYESKVHKPNIIYDNQESQSAEVSVNEYPNYDQFTYDENSIPEIPKSSPPESPKFQDKYQQQNERERQRREQEQREQLQKEQREREKERLEKERREREQQQLELERKNAEARERELKEKERQKELEKKKQPLRASEQPSIQSAIAALTKITSLGAEPIQIDHFQAEEPVDKFHKDQQQASLHQALSAATAITALGAEPIQSTHYKIDSTQKPEQIKEVTPESVILDRFKLRPEPAKVTTIGQEPLSSTVILNSVHAVQREPESVTISVIGSEPIKSTTATHQKPDDQQINIVVDKPVKKPAPQKYSPIIDETTYTTTTKIRKQTSEIHEIIEEIIEQRDPASGEINQNVLETEITSTSVYEPYDQEDDRVSRDQSLNIHQVPINREDEDFDARQQYAEQKFNKQQDVMASLVTAMDNPQLNENLRTYSLYKSEQFFGFGIAFHTEDIAISESYHKLVYPLIEIEPQSPADDAGMKNGQRVVAVNGEFVNKDFKTLEDVVQAIEDSYYSRNFTEITVLEPQHWDEFMENPSLAAQLASSLKPKPTNDLHSYADQIIGSVIDKQPIDKSIPRLCRLSRESRADQYGFDFKTLKNEGKHVANNVRQEFPADKAGLRDGDYILEVNGESIDNIEHDSVVTKISAQPTQVDLLVVADLNAYLNSRQPVITKPSKVDVEIEPIEPIQSIIKKDDVTRHELKLIPEFNGLGISLASNGVINSVEPNSPADRAGLKKDSKIVEVNGVDMKNKTFKEIAKAIKENEKNLQIGVVKMAPKIETSSIITDVIVKPASDIKSSNADLSSISSHKISDPTTTTPSDVRVCNLVNRPDYDGFGFSMRGNDKGPHQISNVEKDSPAFYAGLRNDDLILKVNDINVVGERYNKTVALIKNESEKGRLKLEVIDVQSCSNEIRNVSLTPQSGYSTLNKPVKPSKSGSIDNLRSITAEIISSGSGRDTVRSVSQLPTDRPRTDGDNRKPRPASASDIDRVPQLTNSTVRSNASYGSAATFSSEIRPSNIGSTRSVSSNIGGYRPKFKRCNVQLLPDFNGYGFAINSKIKPKFMIYSVDQNSPAYKANLRETDVIVQIDNKNIRKMKFDKVKQLLSESQKKGQVEILAIDQEGYKYYKDRKKRFSSKKLVTADNTEPYFTVTGQIDSTRERTLSSDIEGDSSKVTSLNQPTSASSSRVQITVPQVKPTTETEDTGTVLDNFDIIACTIIRDGDKPLGLSLSTAVNRSQSTVSRASSASSRKDEDVILPIITSVDAGSAADRSGLRANDLILEINGRSTTGQTNNTVGKWIKSSGDQIEFLVSREKVLTIVSNDNDVIIRENARMIANEAMEKARVIASNEATTHLSRRESAALSNRSGNLSQQGSPQVIHSEVRMSSSRLQQDLPRDEIKVEPSPKQRPRNQSEPSVLTTKNEDSSVNEPHKSGPTSTPLSQRSKSSFNLPRDAPIPRLCRVRAYEEQLGFTVAGSKTNRGVFKVNDVASNSPAAHSGLMNDDQIIEISGVNVESMTYNEVIDYIKERKQEDDLQLLVADKPTVLWYKAKKIPISSQIVPKMQYIETLLKEELQADLTEQNSDKSTSTKRIKIPNNSGQSVFISRKIYLSNKYVLEENQSNNQ